MVFSALGYETYHSLDIHTGMIQVQLNGPVLLGCPMNYMHTANRVFMFVNNWLSAVCTQRVGPNLMGHHQLGKYRGFYRLGNVTIAGIKDPCE